jgi:hypothetical protein
MVVTHNEIINAIVLAENVAYLNAKARANTLRNGETPCAEDNEKAIKIEQWITILQRAEAQVENECITSDDVWNLIQKINEQYRGVDCDVSRTFSRRSSSGGGGNPPSGYVERVLGLLVDNSNPSRPVIEIFVDPLTISGDGTQADPFSAIGGGGGSQDLAQVLAVGNTSGANDIVFDVTQGLLFSNTSRLREGTIDAGLGGNKGIAEICGVGFESKWEAGRRYIMGSSGTTIRQSLYNFNIPPTTSDDASLGYQDGSLWTLDDGTTYECIDAASGNWQLRSNALIIYITVGDLQNLEVLGTLNINALYIVTDAFPYKLMCKAESGGVLSRTAEIIDSTLSGQVLYDLQGDTWLNGAIYDGLGNTWNGTLPTSAITLGAGCAGNTFNQGVRNIELGADSSGNIFEYLSGSGISIICGSGAVNNTFKQGTEGFTFGDGLQNVIIEASVTGADYSALPDYDFLYNKTYSSTIFQSGGINYHRYFDIANDRIEITDLATPTNITYIGGGGATPDIQQVLDAGDTSTTPIIIDDGSGKSVSIGTDLIKFINPLGGAAQIKSSALTVNTVFEIPDKPAGTQTFAMLSDITGGGLIKATAAGTDTYTTTIVGVTGYVDGDTYLIRFTNGNTTGATLNINDGTSFLGAKSLYRNNDGIIIGGDIWAGAEMLCVFNSFLNGFQCIGTSPNSLFAYVVNADSVAITRGQPVYAFGSTGNRMSVQLAYNTTDATSAQTYGLVYSTSIAAGQKGIIIIQGVLDGLNLGGTWADGDPVYLGTTAGTITKTKQYAPNHLVYLGVVERANAGNGIMYVRVQNGFELDELHNVQAQSPTLNDTLYYDNAVTPAQWKTASIATILGYTPISATSTDTLTNKRITARSGTVVSSATPTINTDNVDFFSITGQLVDITNMSTNLTGVPTEGQTLWIAITGTAARAINWGTSFEASTIALPTTTVTTARLDVAFIYNTVTSKWRCVGTC